MHIHVYINIYTFVLFRYLFTDRSVTCHRNVTDRCGISNCDQSVSVAGQHIYILGRDECCPPIRLVSCYCIHSWSIHTHLQPDGTLPKSHHFSYVLIFIIFGGLFTSVCRRIGVFVLAIARSGRSCLAPALTLSLTLRDVKSSPASV